MVLRNFFLFSEGNRGSPQARRYFLAVVELSLFYSNSITRRRVIWG